MLIDVFLSASTRFQILQRKRLLLYQSDAEALLVMLQEHITCWKVTVGTIYVKGTGSGHDTKMKHHLKLTANCSVILCMTTP